jgi:hypothetical protein
MYYLFCQVYRGDRSCVYGDEEHAERVEGLLEEFDRTRERVLTAAERAVEEANRRPAFCPQITEFLMWAIVDSNH